jgi:outer membrane protein TolC
MNLWKKLLVTGALAGMLNSLPPPSAAQTPLEQYVREGLKSNLVLQQKNVSVEKASLALQTASSYFLPAVNFNSSYTSGKGGRSIDIPVGDMLNPVYATLNELTHSDNFPQVRNVKESFFPNNFYDTHLRTTLPLVNTDLHYNRDIQQGQVILQEYDLKVYARDLVRNIKVAYFNYLSAREAVHIYASALQLLEQHVAVNQSLLRNGKALPATLLRARSEVETVKAQHQEAQNNVLNARQYFNFLLNKDQQAPIETSPEGEEIPALPLPTRTEAKDREELEMLKTGERINQTMVRMNHHFWVPKVSAFLDLGSQAEGWRFNGPSRYYLAGVSLEVPVFNAGRNNYKTRQSLLDVKASQLSLTYTARQLEMAASAALNDLNTAYQNYTASQERLRAAKSYFKLMERAYKEGTGTMLEFLDGRNQMTGAQLQLAISTYRVLGSQAQYERETAAYQLPF